MRAAQYDGYGGPDVIQIREVAEPRPGPGQVLVRVEACALNPKDALTRAGKFARLAGPRFPKGIGYDFAGELVGVGEGVTDAQLGQPVYGMLSGWRSCAAAERVAVGADEWSDRPRSLTAVEAAGLPLAAQTALQALRDLAHIRPGHSVAIHGASGGVGTLAVQIAKALGARVTALCGEGAKVLVQGLGADEVIDYRQVPPVRLSGTYDCFFDVFGNQSYWRMKSRLNPGGCYVSTVPSAANIRDHALTAFWPGRRARLVVVRTRRGDLRQIAAWVESGQLRPMVAAVMSLEQMREAHMLIERKRTHGKIVLTVS